MKLHILVGTMTGNAEYAAQAIELDCARPDLAIEVLRMDALTPEVFDRRGLFLICTSTYGSGDVPDNAQAFYAALQAQPRYLGHVRYGVIALGDSSYGETFANGGRRFDACLADLGAQRVGDIHVHDALSGVDPEESAVAWCRDWLTMALAPATEGSGE